MTAATDGDTMACLRKMLLHQIGGGEPVLRLRRCSSSFTTWTGSFARLPQNWITG